MVEHGEADASTQRQEPVLPDTAQTVNRTGPLYRAAVDVTALAADGRTLVHQEGERNAEK